MKRQRQRQRGQRWREYRRGTSFALSIRFPPETVALLGLKARECGIPRSILIRHILHEWLLTHPENGGLTKPELLTGRQWTDRKAETWH